MLSPFRSLEIDVPRPSDMTASQALVLASDPTVTDPDPAAVLVAVSLPLAPG
jgi:hypothetical protein